MTPAARIASAIDILARLEAEDRPADGLLRGVFRANRYIGAKDRRAIGELVYGVLRHGARLDWWIARTGAGTGGARHRVIAELAIERGLDLPGLEALFDGGGYHPPPLEDDGAGSDRGARRGPRSITRSSPPGCVARCPSGCCLNFRRPWAPTGRRSCRRLASRRCSISGSIRSRRRARRSAARSRPRASRARRRPYRPGACGSSGGTPCRPSRPSRRAGSRFRTRAHS